MQQCKDAASSENGEAMLKTLFSIVAGSALGGVLRWGLSVQLNAVWAVMPLGTYLANVIAGYCAGWALAFFTHWPHLSADYRTFVLTGFCGALSTFSTFSVEVLERFQNEQIAAGVFIIGMHLGSALVMTYLGYLSYQYWQSI